MNSKYSGRSGPNHYNWKGGRRINKDGYIDILMPEHPNAHSNRYVLEHVYVLTRMIGRPLNKNEVGHHINGIRDDNRPENLIVMLRQTHSSQHMKGSKNGNQNLRSRPKGIYPPCPCGREYYCAGLCKRCYQNKWARSHRDTKSRWRAKRRALGLPV